MEHSRLYYLFDCYTSGRITSSEELEFAALVIDPANEEVLVELEARYWEKLKDSKDPLPEGAENSLRNILPASVVPLHKKMVRVVAAASIILMIGLGSYFIFSNKNETISETAVKGTVPKDIQAPNTNRATITLANGQTVYIDSMANGSLATQGSVIVTKLADGKIVYSGNTSAIIYNELSNPRGSKVIDMVFSDGSHVWLNAGSSIRYPVAFEGNERKVSVTGEAYFEVAHNTAMPFKVTKGEMEIAVLGTRFNVNAYDDEANIKVTLLGGSVKISNGAASGLLKPFQQAQVADKIAISNDVDIDAVMAWKNGLFYFDGTDIKTIMREVEKWYDVEVNYQSDIQASFVAKISRAENVSELLKILQLTDLVHFKIEGNKITVMK